MVEWLLFFLLLVPCIVTAMMLGRYAMWRMNDMHLPYSERLKRSRNG